jgi:hypothetical protein
VRPVECRVNHHLSLVLNESVISAVILMLYVFREAIFISMNTHAKSLGLCTAAKVAFFLKDAFATARNINMSRAPALKCIGQYTAVRP